MGHSEINPRIQVKFYFVVNAKIIYAKRRKKYTFSHTQKQLTINLFHIAKLHLGISNLQIFKTFRPLSVHDPELLREETGFVKNNIVVGISHPDTMTMK